MKNLTLTLRLILLYVAVLLITPSSLSAQVVGQGLGTSKPIPEAPKPTKEEKKEAKEELENPEPQDRVLYLLENMNLEEKIAQLMFVRINGELSPNTVDSNLLQYLPPGGIVIPSLGRPDTMIDYTQVLQQLSGKAKFPIPFFIAGDAFTHLDSDTRNVNRFLTMPTRLAMGAAGKSNERTQLFNTLADDLKRTGFTMHLGPDLSMSNTLGVNRQSIYTFGNSPSSTADVAYELGEAFSSHDVLWAPQGFPGGSANRSGAGDSVMMTPSSVYLERDGFPYLAAIQAGAAVIHVGNTLVQQPDGSMLPASVSPITITTLLKGSLGFKGLALAGPIDTASMISKFEPEKATLLALQAGADMILWTTSSPQIPKTIAYIKQQAEAGNISPIVIDQAVAKILVAKDKAGLLSPQLNAEDKQSEKILQENRKSQVAFNVERRSITLLKNNNNLLPLLKDKSTPIFLTGVIDLGPMKAALEKELKHVRHFEIKSAKHLTRVQDFELRRLNRLGKGCRTAVCIFDGRIDGKTQAQVIAHLKEKRMKVVVFLLSPPSDISLYQHADALLMGYSDPKQESLTTAALIDVLLGESPVNLVPNDRVIQINVNEEMIFNVLDVIQTPTGKLPLNLEPHYTAGHSVSYVPESIKQVVWEFGDDKNAKGERVSHQYATPGTYTTTVNIKNEDGTEFSENYTVQVNSVQAAR